MQTDNLKPFIRAIEEDLSLSANKKNILCLLISSLEFSKEGLLIKELLEHTKISAPRMYVLLRELESNKLIARSRKGHNTYVSSNLTAVEEIIKREGGKKKLMQKTLRLRYPSSK